MPRAISVKPLRNYRIRVKFTDGTEGIADLSHLVGKGVFSLWNDPKTFANVYVSEGGAIAWNDDIDICPTSLYLRITGKKPEDIFPALREMAAEYARD
jgi:hypothetical protein